jgi:hypothetical protein
MPSSLVRCLPFQRCQRRNTSECSCPLLFISGNLKGGKTNLPRQSLISRSIGPSRVCRGTSAKDDDARFLTPIFSRPRSRISSGCVREDKKRTRGGEVAYSKTRRPQSPTIYLAWNPHCKKAPASAWAVRWFCCRTPEAACYLFQRQLGTWGSQWGVLAGREAGSRATCLTAALPLTL